MPTHVSHRPSRRQFLKAAGCLTIGFPLLASCSASASGGVPGEQLQQLPSSLRNHPAINAWIEVLADGRVRVLTGKMELGQGIQTAIMQVAAEELSMPMRMVEIVMAETGRTPNEGATTGSRSIETSAMAVRYAAAAARHKLVELASKKLNVNSNTLSLANGVVSGGGKSATFAELLAGRQLEDHVKLPLELKQKELHTLVGQPVPRGDIERMVRAEQVYVHEMRFPGMVHARVVRPPSYGASLDRADVARVQAMDGVEKVVVDGSFVGVIASGEYQAVKAQKLLKENTSWAGGSAFPAGQPLKEYIKKLSTDDNVDESRGNLASALSGAAVRHKASYSKPYIMHAANGPSCAVAIFQDGKLDIWSHSQGVYPLREAIAGLLKMSESDIHIKGVPGAGCYGHNGADDVAAEAALLARALPGRHVRLLWMRDEEHAWEPYGTAMVMELEAGLDASGKITAWSYDLWSDAHSTRPGGSARNLLPARFISNPYEPPAGGFRGGATRNAPPYYEVPALQLKSHIFQGPLRVSALRGLGAYANVYAIESFMDELAVKAGADPFEFRLLHCSDSRSIDCITKLRSMVEGVRPAAGEGLGVAFSRYKNSAAYCAVAALAHVDTASGAVRVRKMWATVDAGEVINSDGLKNQIEGGMVQSASWTLKEEVTFDASTVTSRHWASYPIFRFGDVPEVEVLVIDRPDQAPLGAGEASQGPAAAAVANAVFRACGKRVRDLPIKPAKIAG